MSARNFAGVTGRSRIRIFKGCKAFSIAETITAGAPIVPLSAAPFTPSAGGLKDLLFS
jgi:hypothetical protein